MASDLSKDLSDIELFNTYEHNEHVPLIKVSSNAKRRCKKKKREVKIRAVDKQSETLVITQKVEVKKQKMKCVINLNTSIHEKIVNVDRECCKQKQKNARRLTERILPVCYRSQCKKVCNYMRYKYYRTQRKKLEHTNHIHRKNTSNTDSYKKTKQSNDRKKEEPKGNMNIRKALSLSPISQSSLKSYSKEMQISYDNISVDSFTSYPDSKIDTLIKRTKEREKHTFTLSSNFLCKPPQHTSTPHSVIVVSSDEETVEGSKQSASNSIHSLATLVLEPIVDSLTYSPTINVETKAGTLDYQYNHEEEPEQKYNIIPLHADMSQLVLGNKTQIKCELSGYPCIKEDINPYILLDNNNEYHIKNENVDLYKNN